VLAHVVRGGGVFVAVLAETMWVRLGRFCAVPKHGGRRGGRRRRTERGRKRVHAVIAGGGAECIERCRGMSR